MAKAIFGYLDCDMFVSVTFPREPVIPDSSMTKINSDDLLGEWKGEAVFENQQEYEKAIKDFKSNGKVFLKDGVKLTCVKRLENYPHLKTYQDVLDYYTKACGYD